VSTVLRMPAKTKRFGQRKVRAAAQKAYVRSPANIQLHGHRVTGPAGKHCGVTQVKTDIAGQRFVVRVVKEGLHKGDPYEPLLRSISKTGGRTTPAVSRRANQGGGHKRNYRVIDFKARQGRRGGEDRAAGIRSEIARRTWHSWCIRTAIGVTILAPKHAQPGDAIMAGTDAPIKPAMRCR